MSMGQLEIIQNALNWQKEAGGRRVDIEAAPDRFKVWCYDYNLMHGEHVQDGRMIDLDASCKAARKAEFEKLKAEFE